MRRIAVSLVACLVVLSGLLVVAGHAQDSRLAAASVIEQIKQRNLLRVGVSPTLPPAATRGKSGDLIGFEIDVAKRLADDMGVKVEFVPTVWDGLIPGLFAGKFDVIISEMTITPARNLAVNFTIPYAHAGLMMAANKKLAAGFKSIEDFNKPTVTIAAMRGSTTAVNALKLMPKATTRQFDDQAQCMQEVVNGKAHAFLASAPRPLFAVMEYPDTLFLPMEEPLLKSNEGFAVRKGDPDALAFFNTWITLRLNDGWLQERRDYWFKTKQWADLVAPPPAK